MFFQRGSSKSHTNKPSSEAVGDHSPLQYGKGKDSGKVFLDGHLRRQHGELSKAVRNGLAGVLTALLIFATAFSDELLTWGALLMSEPPTKASNLSVYSRATLTSRELQRGFINRNSLMFTLPYDVDSPIMVNEQINLLGEQFGVGKVHFERRLRTKANFKGFRIFEPRYASFSIKHYTFSPKDREYIETFNPVIQERVQGSILSKLVPLSTTKQWQKITFDYEVFNAIREEGDEWIVTLPLLQEDRSSRKNVQAQFFFPKEVALESVRTKAVVSFIKVDKTRGMYFHQEDLAPYFVEGRQSVLGGRSLIVRAPNGREGVSIPGGGNIIVEFSFPSPHLLLKKQEAVSTG